jgi:hypothetical protein
LALAWFSPLFAGSSYSAVPGYENVVYPWAAHTNGAAFFPQSDQAALNLGLQSELSASLKDGTIPWWNADSFGGQPLFSDGSSALLYPPRLILAKTVSPTTAHNVLSVLHVTLAGLFTYWLLVDLEVSPLAALFGAVAWMFGSFTLGWLQLEVVAPVFAWLPAGLVTMRRAVLRNWRWTVGGAVSIAMLFVSSHLLFADICVVTIGAYGGCLALSSFISRWRRVHGWRSLEPFARVAVSAALGLGLAGFVLVPTAATLSDISRQTLSFSQLSRGMLLPVADLRYAFWPVSLPITEAKMQWGLTFAGTLTAVFALIGLFLGHKGSGLGRGLVIGSVLVAIGGPVSWLAFEVVPGMNIFRPYARLIFVFDLGLAVLGAVGLDAVMGNLARRPFALTAGGRQHLAARHSRHQRGWWISRGFAIVMVAVTALQLGWYGRQINPPFLPTTRATTFRVTPLLRALKAGHGDPTGWPDRVLPANDSLSGWSQPMLDSNDALVFGIDSASGYDSSVPTRTVDLWRIVAGESPGEVLATKLQGAFQPTFDALTVRYDLLPRLGVDQIALTPKAADIPSLVAKIEASGWKIVYAGTDGSVFEWDGGPSGPYVAFDSMHDVGDRSALEEFVNPTFPYTRQVILDQAGGSRSPTPGSATVISAHRGVNSAAITVRTSMAAYVVIPDMWDPGWSATVNGTTAVVQRADFNEQAVAIPAGISTVQLRYRPVGLTEGLVLTGASMVICAAVILVSILAERRRRRASPDQ